MAGISIRSGAGAPEPKRRGGFLSKLILAAILIAAFSFFIAPWFALQAVRSAADSHDSAALADMIDYGQVRAGLRDQLYAQAQPGGQPPPPDVWHDPVGALRAALQHTAVAGPNVESYLTPEALQALLNGRAPGAPSNARPWPRLRYWGFDRCRLAVPDPANPNRETLLTFQRRGFYTWKLSQIRLPEG
jgi:hypothetical protein